MKILKIINLPILAIMIFLEALPFGVKMSWASDEGFSSISYHSYFDTLPWGYGDMGPFFCAIISVALFVLILLSLFFKKRHDTYLLVVEILSWVAVLFSFMPLMFNSYTLFGGIISALMVIVAEINRLVRTKNRK